MHRSLFVGVLAAILLVFSTAATAAEPFPCAYSAVRDAGWAEAVLKVHEPQLLVEFAERVAGWQATAIPDGGWLLHDAAYGVGALRVLRAAPRTPRPAPYRPWDTGGLFSVMTRSNDLHGAFAAATALGWSAANTPVTLEFGGVTLANVVLRGASGVNVAIYERLQPRMPDEPDLRKLRRPFNAMQVVHDLPRAKSFYVDLLGFSTLASGRFRTPPGSPNNFGIPAPIADGAALDYMILAPSTTGSTQIEVVSFAGVDSRPRRARDFEAVGLVALRFPVRSLTELRKRLSLANYPYETATILLPPYGETTGLRVRSPEGARLEFFTLESTACR